MGIDRIQSLKRYIGEAADETFSGVNDPSYNRGHRGDRSHSRFACASWSLRPTKIGYGCIGVIRVIRGDESNWPCVQEKGVSHLNKL